MAWQVDPGQILPKNRKILGCTMCNTLYVVDPQLSGPAGGRAFFRVHSNSVLCYRFSVNGQSWVCCCTRVERLIFDSLVLSPCTTGICPPSALWLFGVMKSEADFKM